MKRLVAHPEQDTPTSLSDGECKISKRLLQLERYGEEPVAPETANAPPNQHLRKYPKW